MKYKKLAKVYKLSKMKNNLDIVPTKAGVYKFFVDEKGLSLLDNIKCNVHETINNQKIYLLYVGISKDLRYRFKWHFGLINAKHENILNGTLSTFRFSLMANNTQITCLSQQEILNKFMNNYIYLQYLITEDYELIEKDLIKKYKPPLNIKDNTSLFVDINKSRRQNMLYKYKNTNITLNNDINKNNKIDIESINYGKNGKFINTITNNIINLTKQINNHESISINLGITGGYIANNILIVISDNNKQFFTNLRLRDKSRFPARVKNLAIVLKELKLYGEYIISHNDGILKLQKIL